MYSICRYCTYRAESVARTHEPVGKIFLCRRRREDCQGKLFGSEGVWIVSIHSVTRLLERHGAETVNIDQSLLKGHERRSGSPTDIAIDSRQRRIPIISLDKEALPAAKGLTTNPAAMPGFDYKFLEKPKRRFQCPLCSKAMREPVQVSTCGHRFCDTCLQEFLR